MTKRILILSTSIGNGHVKAALALRDKFLELDNTLEVVHCDILENVSGLTKFIFQKTYIGLINTAPHLLGYFYDYLDRPYKFNFWKNTLRLLLSGFCFRKTVNLITSEYWDLYVSTHFFSAELIANLIKKNKLRSPQVIVCTDFNAHRMWVNQPCHKYFCASTDAFHYLNLLGVPKNNISVTGIPITNLGRVFHDSKQGKNILIMGGSQSFDTLAELYKSVLTINTPLNIVVIAHKHHKTINSIPRPNRHKVTVIEYSNTVNNLMAWADVLISKPGGLTSSEALAHGTPILIVNPIPGQEDQNSDFILENKAGLKISHPALTHVKIKHLLNSQTELKEMKDNALKIGKPNAAESIVKQCLELIND